jgi:uncharacterized protein YdaU (DUF1376 family)
VGATVNFYKRYIGDYQRDTGHLSLLEHGVYTVLLDHYYARRSPLPGDIAVLCRLCRANTKAERRAVKAVAEQFFPVTADGLRMNARAARELEKWETQARHNREVGKLGGRPPTKAKGINGTDNPSGNPDANPGANPEITREVSREKPEGEPAGNPLQNPETRIRNSVPLGGSLRVDRAALAATARKINKHRNGKAEPEPEETRLGRALELLRKQPDFPLDKIATMFRLDTAALAKLREAAA